MSVRLSKKLSLFCAGVVCALAIAGCAANAPYVVSDSPGVTSDSPGATETAPEAPGKYGVFLGINEDESAKLGDYGLVVIEPSEFSAARIEELQVGGTQVYGYLNIGSVEEYRPYYERFEQLTLGVYEDWPRERWVDVASPEWQHFVVDELGQQYADMGVDGLFLDNADIYYHYPTEGVFQGLRAILEGLGQYEVPLVINGGDVFVERCMEAGDASSLFDAVNQETVFTRIDFENRTYGVQAPEETAYFKEYLGKAKDAGLDVYLLEYGADGELSREIDAYCSENGCRWYNAESLELR